MAALAQHFCFTNEKGGFSGLLQLDRGVDE
jgi:hypothetical protein